MEQWLRSKLAVTRLRTVRTSSGRPHLRDKTCFTASWAEPSGESSLKAHGVVLVSLLRNVVVATKVPMQESH
jgi:hypothetical protein